MSNPVEAYLEEREKVAGDWLSGTSKGIGRVFSPMVLGTVASTAALSAALDIPGAVARKAYYAVTKKRDFTQMMESDPTLGQFQRENPKQFNAHYSSLRSMNPQFAADPVVAGTYMRQMSMSPATAGSVIVESLGGLPRSAPPMVAPKDIMGAMDSDMSPLQQEQLNAMKNEAPRKRRQGLHKDREAGFKADTAQAQHGAVKDYIGSWKDKGMPGPPGFAVQKGKY